MSIHSDKAFTVAKSKGAAAGKDYVRWTDLNRYSKRELIEAGLHLAALCTDSYEAALDGHDAYFRLTRELETLRKNGLT